MRIFRKGLIEMTEKVEVKIVLTEQQEKAAFFEAEAKKRRQAEIGALIKGWLVVGLLLVFDFFFFSHFGLWGLLLIIPSFAIFFMVMYFIWGPQNVGWGSFVKEGCYRAITIGGKRHRYIFSARGKEVDGDFNVLPAERVTVKRRPIRPDLQAVVCLTWDPYFDLVILGLHIIPEWPFARIYEEATEWERYYPTQKKALSRRELINQFTLLPYPHYDDVIGAEDKNRLSIDMLTNDVVEITNLEKATFKEAVPLIDIIKPIIRGGKISFIKGTSLQELLAPGKDIGTELIDKMLAPAEFVVGGVQEKLVGMLERLYGARIISISIIDIVGADKDLQDAINAKAIANLKRDAALIEGDANAQKAAVETIGQVIKMLAQMDIQIDPDKDEAEQKKELIKAENRIKAMSPEDFEKIYGEKFKICIDLVHRNMAIKGGNFADMRTPDIKGGSTADLMSLVVASKLLPEGGGTKPVNTEKPEGGKKYFSKRNKQ